MAFDWNGVTLHYSVDTSSTWTEVAQLTDLDGPSMEVAEIDITSNDDTWDQFDPGTFNAGEISFTGRMTALDSLEDQLGIALTTTHVTTWKITFPDAASTVWRFPGWLKSLGASGSLNNAYDRSGTIKLTAAPVFL